MTSEGEMNVLKDIAEMDAYDLNFCLQKFVFEVRKQNGDKYPAKTLYDIFSMLNYFTYKTILVIHILFSKAMNFYYLGSVLKQQRKKHLPLHGVTSGENKSKAISLQEENILWDSGILKDWS